MLRFRSSWTKQSSIALALAVMVGCASNSLIINDEFPGTFYYNASFDGGKQDGGMVGSVYWTSMEHPPKDWTISKAGTSWGLAHAMHRYFCQHGKQVHQLSFHVKYLVPKIPAGVPLDEAANYRANAIAAGREKVKGIFLELSSVDHFKNGQAQTGNQLRALFDDGPAYYQQISFLALMESSVGKPSNYFKDASGQDLMYIGTPKDEVLYLVPLDPKKVFPISAIQSSTAEAPSVPWHVDSEFKDDGHRFFAVTTPVKLGTQSVYPLTYAFSIEGLVFQRMFTFLIPKDVQEKFFRNISIPLFDGPPRHYFGYEDEKLKPSEAIKDQEAAWRFYVAAFTSVREAPDPEDPQVIRFDASVELDAFCSYARPLNELVSQ